MNNTTNIVDLNETARRVAVEANRRFPDLSPDTIKLTARFIAAAGGIINACNATLAKNGRCLSERGLEFALTKAVELAKAE